MAGVGTEIVSVVGGMAGMTAGGGTRVAGASTGQSAVGSGPVRVIEYGDSIAGEAGDLFDTFLGPSAVAGNHTYGGASPCT
jgi:hypothetical protein